MTRLVCVGGVRIVRHIRIVHSAPIGIGRGVWCMRIVSLWCRNMRSRLIIDLSLLVSVCRRWSSSYLSIHWSSCSIRCILLSARIVGSTAAQDIQNLLLVIRSIDSDKNTTSFKLVLIVVGLLFWYAHLCQCSVHVTSSSANGSSTEDCRKHTACNVSLHCSTRVSHDISDVLVCKSHAIKFTNSTLSLGTCWKDTYNRRTFMYCHIKSPF